MKKIILKIDGMSCSACQNRVEKYLNKQNGIEATVNLVMANATINYDEDKVTTEDLERFISEAGYKSLGIYKGEEKNNEESKKPFILFAILIVIIMYISMMHMLKIPSIPYLNMKKYPVNYTIVLFILTIPFILFGFDIIKRGIVNLVHKRPNMDTLVTVGVLSSLIYSIINMILIILGNNSLMENLYFESSAMIIYFIKLGRFISKKTKEKTKASIKKLVQITPQSAMIKEKGEIREITIDEVKKGDILICKPGMKIAVDGIIKEGIAHIDEAFITGESIPRKKEKNDKVVAGSINLDGYIEYKAEKIGRNSTISEIVRLVVEAANTKAPISKTADIVSGYFTESIITIATLTFIIYLILGHSLNESIISFVTILVVSCPCALGLATPLAIVASIGSSAKNGILIKTSEILENSYKTDTIIFDKTGTLTYGKLKISSLKNYSKYKDRELLQIIAGIESKSSHPISYAFKKYYDKNIEVTNFKEIAGEGLTGIVNGKKIYIGGVKIIEKLKIKSSHTNSEKELAEEGNSIIYVIEENKIIALIGVKDIVRNNAKQTIAGLKKMNKDIIMLSGDREKSANNIAKELGIEKVIANVMPKEKHQIIKDLINNNHKVMMIGDGINDAPSLVNATIGVSLSGATDIAADSADVIIMQDDLSKIIDLLKISKKTDKIIKQNLFWAFIYNVIMIPIAIGLFKPFNINISPMLASVTMIISSLIVVFNSTRLK